MSAKFITSVLVAGAFIAALAGAQPAQAGDRDDLKRFIGAAAGIYLLGQAIEHGRIDVHHQSRPKAHPGHGKKKAGKKHHGKKKWRRASLPSF